MVGKREKDYYRKICKRFIDFLGSLILLIFLSPVLLLIAFMIRVTMGSPILFRQKRTGLNGQSFTIYKFRTMDEKKDKNGRLLPDEKRLTKLGRFLRNTSLDELPELWNVLKGDMSLVGPRPLLPEYLLHYTKEQMRRHEVKPGITGWAQVNGRNLLNWDEKFKYDVWYVDNISFWLDMKILFLTIFKVLKREGISKPGFATEISFIDYIKQKEHNVKGA